MFNKEIREAVTNYRRAGGTVTIRASAAQEPAFRTLGPRVFAALVKKMPPGYSVTVRAQPARYVVVPPLDAETIDLITSTLQDQVIVSSDDFTTEVSVVTRGVSLPQ